MTVLRYPAKALLGDYLRAGVGLAVGLGVLASVPPSPFIVVVFGGLSALFLVFGLRTMRRQVTQIAVDDRGIQSAGFGTRAVPWDALEQLKLRYYGTRRQRNRGEGEGFMQLTLRGAGTSVVLESSVDGFAYIAWCAAKAARENGVSLDPTSAGNLLDIGVDADADHPAPPIDMPTGARP